MAKKGLSITRLNVKIALMLIIPILTFSQIPGPMGQPLIDLGDFNPLIWAKDLYHATKKQLQTLNIATRSFTNQPETANNQHTLIYRWRDKFGNWHYSQQPPVTSITFERVALGGNGIRMPKPDDRLTAILSVNDKPDIGSQPKTTLPVSLSPNSVKNLLQGTKDIQQTMIDRNKQLEKL